jgi:hypothetical protein
MTERVRAMEKKPDEITMDEIKFDPEVIHQSDIFIGDPCTIQVRSSEGLRFAVIPCGRDATTTTLTELVEDLHKLARKHKCTIICGEQRQGGGRSESIEC